MKNSNIPLIVGISLPFLMILVILAILYLPSMFVRPQYDFVYTISTTRYAVDSNPNCNDVEPCLQKTYVVKDDKIIEEMRPTNRYDQSTEVLYVYDVENDSARPVAYEDAAELTLTADSRSPDGFSIEQQYGHAGVFELFGGSYNNPSWMLKKGMATKSLAIPSGGASLYYGDGRISFLGWVIEQ